MEFRFDHVGFLTPDVDYSFGVYRALGCRLTERTYRRGSHDVAYGGAGTDVLLEFQGPPLLPESEEYLARQPWSIERVALVCDDVEAAHARLMEAGVASAWAPEPFVIDGVTLAIAAGVWSPEGLMIDLVEHRDVAVPRPARGPREDLALHHVCFVTSDLVRAEAFWVEQFGLVKTYDFTAPLEGGGTQGLVMLSDPFFDAAGHEFSLEIISGAFDTIDGPVFERRGSCYDHVCFTTGDVAGTWQRAVDRGVEPLSEPAYYPEHDTTIAWLYDADGTHIELMDPVPADLMVDAHRSGRCANGWVDDWNREPVVLPRRGDTALQVRRHGDR
ncbi:MAG: hypothetical protein F4110_09400 [Acidimicrobiaceae bacterium]|nr:hypothetical protein [Acidimicrobiaceae bacterium]MYH00285.1 hypothetical protein [Acidimicrobiaceae bacterium]MYH43125.1 hypothetical protein [Acidimicrobiaceae bacterium]MYI54177.1 hypothetical protein [Acidimicrobiaceae bacterium]MYK73901.1 hypothetical protein [Acidimicrobiaceae bacterium]